MIEVELIRCVFDFLKNYGGERLIADPSNQNYDKKKYDDINTLKMLAFDDVWKKLSDDVVKRASVNNKKIILVQTWQNSGMIYNYFWSQLKDINRKESSSSISLFARKDCFEVKVTWHFKHGDKSNNTLKEHNHWLEKLDHWANINPDTANNYSIWYGANTNKDTKVPLTDFLKDTVKRNELYIRIEEEKDFLIEPGICISMDDVIKSPHIEDLLAKTVLQLEYLYNATVAENNDTQETTPQEAINSLIESITKSGFSFEPWQIAAYVAALRTKPFVILAGVSGTGKSKLPSLVAKITGAEARLLPVRPDWTDSSDVLGYMDLQGTFRPGALLQFAREAGENKNKNYVCIIDEMNIARVEHYFAEVLSRLEDRWPSPDGGYQSGPLISQKLLEADKLWAEQGLPTNLAIVGTVNMDEITYGFSRKVLDRAFTIELSDIDLGRWEPVNHLEIEILNWPSQAWFPTAIQLGISIQA